jgi:hypothetical protein
MDLAVHTSTSRYRLEDIQAGAAGYRGSQGDCATAEPTESAVANELLHKAIIVISS